MSRFLLILLLSCVLRSEVVYSQAATTSLFSEMLSINPATVGARTIGVFSVSPKIDKIEKLQDASNGFSSSSSSVNIVENLDVKAGTFFFGGKAGVLTSELYLEIAKGEKTISISSGTEGNEVKLAGDNKFLRYNLAFKKFFGIGLGYMDFNNSTEFTTRFQGQSFSDSNKGENTITMIRPGFAFELFKVHFAFYAEKLNNEETTKSAGGESLESKTKTKTTYFGGAVGYATKTLHIELAYEKQKEDNQINKYDDNGLFQELLFLNPSRTTLVIEGKFGKLGLGYTGQYYQDGYINYQDYILNQLAYLNSKEEARLENNFNFSWGTDKGHGISGSFSTSKTNGKEKSLFTGNKQLPTTTKATSASLKYSYSW